MITLFSGKAAAHSPAAMRSASLIRPTSPKSPGASASAFESIEGSDDEENVTDNIKLDVTYLHANGNAVSEVLILETLHLDIFFVFALLFSIRVFCNSSHMFRAQSIWEFEQPNLKLKRFFRIKNKRMRRFSVPYC